jgi:hypothetical protein
MVNNNAAADKIKAEIVELEKRYTYYSKAGEKTTALAVASRIETLEKLEKAARRG